MRIKILSVHPTVTWIESNGNTTDISTDWFPERPEVGQTWELTFTRERSNTDRLADLNRLLGTE